ncbi:alpha/beta hydrolase [Hoyosella rhizosphaerae]|uniref:Lysophospholipase n=1 Tax=Hoyosella rhizosphaerae TaxID=1755582 RepID=A0A916X9I1_9ACTN|nr:alpha/beta hydrolase [Hoyosella rhizosphaerae]MBN4927001.1 alpha/beta hydrolase [Hoyosella rhizosphaerae]GGC54821.1 lysophospholipase [Hoyosella rhizosphaerae]
MTDKRLPIVFVHGIRLSHAEWSAEVDLLHTRGYQATAVDLPGHGLRRGDKFTLDGATGIIADAIDELGGTALLVGHSLGGYVALAAAAQFPDKLAGLVVTGSTATPNRYLGLPFLGAHQALTRLPNSGDAVSRFAMQRLAPPRTGQAIVERGIATEVIPDVVREVVGFNPLAAAAQFTGPTWYINGRHDHFRLHEKRFLNASADGRLHVVRGAGHYLPITHADEFTAILENIVEELTTSA